MFVTNYLFKQNFVYVWCFVKPRQVKKFCFSLEARDLVFAV